MHNCTSNCIGSVEELLTDILNQDAATTIRLSQLVQAFEVDAGLPQSNQGSPLTPTIACSDDESGLLASILAQRTANFNKLELILAAV